MAGRPLKNHESITVPSGPSPDNRGPLHFRIDGLLKVADINGGRRLLPAWRQYMFKKFLGLILAVFAAPALAGDLSYNYFELGYQRIDVDDINVDGDGFGLGGSFEVGENWFITASYATAELDFGVDFDQLSAGVGYHVDMSENADFFATLSYVSVEASVPGFGSADDDGFGVSIGVRGMVSEKVELTGSLGYVDLSDSGDSTSFGASGYYNFNDAFALGLVVSTDDDVTAYGLGARFYFGN